MVSNRGPVEYWLDETGHMRQREANGGVATALNGVARSYPSLWISAAAGGAEDSLARLKQRVPIGRQSESRLVKVPSCAYEAYYESFCNPILWFVQHSLTDSLRSRTLEEDALSSWQAGYVSVNRLFADAVIEELPAGPARQVMLHDYHLYLAPRLIRAARPRTALQHFVHIPWPATSAWAALPNEIVTQIVDGLLANDSVVFQDEDSVENFLATCRAYLPEAAAVSDLRGEVDYRGIRTSVWSNPISVEIPELESQRATAGFELARRSLARLTANTKTIVRVDRLDPSKNIVRGFEAFELLLERNPGLQGNVTFLAFLVPSRTNIPEYSDYKAECLRLVERINGRFGGDGQQPVHLFYEQNRVQALAALSLYDVLLVNSVADGLNLVSKEGPILNGRDGVLVLSTATGSYRELRRGAIGVDPFDVAATATAIETALGLPDTERRVRADHLRESISRHQLSDWYRQQLKDLSLIEDTRSGQAVISPFSSAAFEPLA
jgi:trehalose 6-phosphate synthase